MFPGFAALLDDFNRGDEGPPMTNWTDVTNGLKVLNNQCVRSVIGTNMSYWNASNFGPNVEISIDIPTLGQFIALYGRLIMPAFNGYAVFFLQQAGSDFVGIQRVDSGVGTTLGGFIAQEFSAGDSLGMSIIGDEIRAFRKTGGVWTELGVRSDGTYTAANRVALLLASTTGVLDNFSAGDILLNNYKLLADNRGG